MGPVRKIAEGRYLGLYERDRWEFADRPNAEGVVGILAVTPTDEIVLVEQLRRPVGCSVIEMPAGLVGDEEEHRGESLEQTACRELVEETGFQAGVMTLLMSSPTSAGMTPEITHLFLATDLERVSRGGGVAGEDIRVHEVPRKELSGWLAQREADGLLIDFKIHAALWQARFHGLQ